MNTVINTEFYHNKNDMNHNSLLFFPKKQSTLNGT